MTDLETRLEEVKAEILDVQRQIMRAEYEKDTAAAARAEALHNLKTLGADSEEQGQQLLANLTEELTAELRRVQQDLADGE